MWFYPKKKPPDEFTNSLILPNPQLEMDYPQAQGSKQKNSLEFIPAAIIKTAKFRNKLLRGYTLLEIMLALSIISIALLTIIHSFSLIARSKAAAINYTKASLLLEAKLHDLKTNGFNQRSRQGVFNSPFERFSWQADSEIIPAGGLRRVLLVISWREGEQDKELQIVTYLRQKS